MEFDYQLHIFKYPGLESIVGKAVEFFSSTPVHSLPPPETFSGPGVYGLYYIGSYEPYAPLGNPNFTRPIYIGKAVPPGSRTARSLGGASNNLIGRLQEHAESIKVATNLDINDFRCRFMILDELERDLIGPVESELIRTHKPLWNTCISGFGIHTPGKGRFGQQPSEWDTLHPGRPFVEKLTGDPRDMQILKGKISKCLETSSWLPLS